MGLLMLNITKLPAQTLARTRKTATLLHLKKSWISPGFMY
jgi:hypothetical protein